MFNKLNSLTTYLCRFSLIISTVALVIIILLNCSNLLARWIYKSPFDWVLEISLILFVYMVCFIIPILYQDNNFVQMHLVEEIINTKTKNILNIFVDISVIIFFLYLIPVSFKLSIDQIDLLSRGLGFPRIYVTMPVPIFSSIIIFIGILKIYRKIKDFKS